MKEISFEKIRTIFISIDVPHIYIKAKILFYLSIINPINKNKKQNNIYIVNQKKS